MEHKKTRAKPHRRPNDADAFIRADQPRTGDALAEALAEQFLSSATSGEESGEDAHEEIVPEEDGGPFVVTKAKEELAKGTDESNPAGANREPLPTPMRG